jgi:hypothetical protein
MERQREQAQAQREADRSRQQQEQAQREADRSRQQQEQAQREADRSRQQQEQAQREADRSRQQQEQAQREADRSRRQQEQAQREADRSRQQQEQAQREADRSRQQQEQAQREADRSRRQQEQAQREADRSRRQQEQAQQQADPDRQPRQLGDGSTSSSRNDGHSRRDFDWQQQRPPQQAQQQADPDRQPRQQGDGSSSSSRNDDRSLRDADWQQQRPPQQAQQQADPDRQPRQQGDGSTSSSRNDGSSGRDSDWQRQQQRPSQQAQQQADPDRQQRGDARSQRDNANDRNRSDDGDGQWRQQPSDQQYARQQQGQTQRDANGGDSRSQNTSSRSDAPTSVTVPSNGDGSAQQNDVGSDRPIVSTADSAAAAGDASGSSDSPSSGSDGDDQQRDTPDAGDGDRNGDTAAGNADTAADDDVPDVMGSTPAPGVAGNPATPDAPDARARAIEERQNAARRERLRRRELAERARRDAEQGQLAPLPPDHGGAPETSSAPARSADAKVDASAAEKPVAWLSGFQKQASHLGVKPGDEADETAVPVTKPVTASPSVKAGTETASTTAGGTADNAAQVVGKAAPPASTVAVAPTTPPSASLPSTGGSSSPEPAVEEVVKKADKELVVTGLTKADIEKVKNLGGSVTSSAGGAQRIEVPADVARERFRQLLKQDMASLEFTDNAVYTIFLGQIGESDGVGREKSMPASSKPCPGDTCFASRLIHWKSSLGACARNVRVGIIDTSFDTTHPAFKNLSVEQGEFLDGERPSPYDWHGTAVLSLLAGDPSSGTPGLIPDATFLLATAFRSDAAGNASTDTVRLLKALAWLESRGVQYINMSFSGPRDPKFEKEIQRLRKKGIVFVAAAGNLGPTAPPSYPAAYPEVIAVTAVNRDGENYRHANRGDYIDVAAPGVDVLAALPDAKQGYRTGTSFAAPFVTAIVATHGGALQPVAKTRVLQQVDMRDLGPPGRDPIYGGGLAQAPQACLGGADQIAKSAPPVESLPAAAVVPAVKSGSSPPVAKIEAKFEPPAKAAPAVKALPPVPGPTISSGPPVGAWDTTTTLIEASSGAP